MRAYLSTSRAFPHLVFLAVIASVTLFFRLGALPLTGADEPRYARIAEEMRDRGAWVTPSLQGSPWLEKPPLYYWITRPFYSVFNTSEVAARVGPALCALITALAVYWIGSVLWTPLAGILSSCMLLTTLGWAGFGRSATTDMPFTCCLTLALAILTAAVGKPSRESITSSSKCKIPASLFTLLAWIFLGFAVLGKGPVAVVLAAGIILSFWLLDERGDARRRCMPFVGVLLTAVVALPWFWLAFRENGYAFIATFFINHNLARYTTDVHHHAQPFYYYLLVLPALFFPWSGWLLALMPKSRQSFTRGLRNRRQWHSGTVFITCWFFVPMIFFSLSGSKLAGYILPSLPPLALLIGARLAEFIQGKRELPRLRAGLYVNLILSIGMAIAAPIFFQKDYGGNWKVGLSISAAVLLPAIVAFLYGRKSSRGDAVIPSESGSRNDGGKNCLTAIKFTILQGGLLVGAAAVFAFPVLGDYHSTRAIAYQALELKQGDEPIVMYRFFHHTLQYYTGYIAEKRIDEIDALRRFARTNPSFLVVTKKDGTRDIEDCGVFATELLFRQGNFVLLRLTSK